MAVFTAGTSISQGNAVKHVLLLVSRAHITWCWCFRLSLHHYHNLATSELISCCKSISYLGKLGLPVKSPSRTLNTQDASTSPVITSVCRCTHCFSPITQTNEILFLSNVFGGSQGIITSDHMHFWWANAWKREENNFWKFRSDCVLQAGAGDTLAPLYMHTWLWRSPPAAACISSFSLSSSELSPRGLRLRCPAASSGARSEERAITPLLDWSWREPACLALDSKRHFWEGFFRQKRQKCVKNILTLLPYCAFWKARVILRNIFPPRIRTWKSESGGHFWIWHPVDF